MTETLIKVEGRVKWFDTNKGFGFISCPEVGDVLLHAKVLRDAKLRPSVEEGQVVECEITRQERGYRASKVLAVRLNLSTEQRMALQNAEFDACDDLAKQYRRITMTPVVDDDYPAVRHEYEGAVGTFLRACKANGRIL